MPKNRQPALSALENAVMQLVWDNQPTTAEDVRKQLEDSHDLKASTVRTLLGRLEVKGYVGHIIEGRTYIYSATVEQTNVAATAVRAIVERFCAGSVENLLTGLVDDEQISPERLKKLADEIATAEKGRMKAEKKTRRSRRN